VAMLARELIRRRYNRSIMVVHPRYSHSLGRLQFEEVTSTPINGTRTEPAPAVNIVDGMRHLQDIRCRGIINDQQSADAAEELLLLLQRDSRP
jgi:hypothetical protein